MHDRGHDLEKAVSLPALLSNFAAQDQQHWLNLIMEAAGINEQVDQLNRVIDSEREAEEEVEGGDGRLLPGNSTKMELMFNKTRALYEKEVRKI